ncbi:tetraacyldisaccharide 4'-kinase [Mariniblastus fucicola]|uniref:Tetraacyldisaccharide 4'-kinase n=1 Tax=Mariniblastus fucicola TaxID=980251 RepID=A0A5B9PBL9_9BACT|nr:tetraacyldisaccharide 4'-kinase [Mariniblastus fucicola]QEG20533.1 Tetraacyldisaccharide 4'-kinase [Mariniblastus fucicola]
MSIPWLLRIVSGKQKGPAAALVRVGLWSLTPIYRFAVWFRNRQFDTGSRDITSVDAKVISIGNLTTGGTGKTPMVVWVSQLLQRNNLSVGIVSRGYGSRDDQTPNDEALELLSRLPAVPHVQNPDRVAAARSCIEKHSVDAIVLDDGFQHRRIGRDLDIVLIDASNPFGFGNVLPRGLLREPISSLKRADIVVVTRCDRVEADMVLATRRRIAAETSAPIVLARTTANSLFQHKNSEATTTDEPTEIPIAKAHSGRWFAFSAIGNPESFEASLAELQLDVLGSIRFRDHHHFDDGDLRKIVVAAKQAGADRLVCTHKDLVKISRESIGDRPVFALKIDFEIFEGQEEIEQAILDLFATLKALE